MTPSKTLLRLRKTLDRYGRVTCKGQKAECCGAIMMTQEEKDLATRHLYRKGLQEPPRGRGKDGCEYLTKEGKCSVYEERPLVCRGFGTIKSMNGPCSGCKTTLQIEEVPGMRAYMMSSIVPNEYSKSLFEEIGVKDLADLVSKATAQSVTPDLLSSKE